MPIHCPISFCRLSQEEFGRLDYQVMRHAFDCQNELGRLCDEVIYKNDLAARLEAAGLGPVRREVPLVVTHEGFTKRYALDATVGDRAIYEAKVAARLVEEHDAQGFNYLFLAGAERGKLLNFRPAQVESRFLNATVTPEERRRFTVDTRRWQPLGDAGEKLKARLLALLADWGGFLDLALYTEALTWFLGGEQAVVRAVPLTRHGLPLGQQRFHLLAPDVAFRLTALPEDGAAAYEAQLRALLRLSPLRAVQWINLPYHQVQFVTLIK